MNLWYNISENNKEIWPKNQGGLNLKRIIELIGMWDLIIFYTVNDKIKSDISDKLIPYFTEFGSWWFTTFACLLTILLGKEKTRSTGIEAAASLVAGNFLVQLLKKKINRERPYLAILNVNTFNKLWKDHSFPSGHTAAAFEVAVSMSFGYPNLYLLFIGLATMVGVSRIYVGMHYPTDVLIGAALGSSMSILTHILI